MNSRAICWTYDDRLKCFWQREWERLHNIACDLVPKEKLDLFHSLVREEEE
jgi:hypothetical protein